ncbi:peptide chain release factor N(5)-glutamine methyltransferase [Paenibacillus sp. GCM10027626]|uniref:peptide chain release factor N(5)-glutamine methyltransferase n=1 Tax=Paenibacillus sp. GCM10027626 TaxID=3273411 RepID=UPI00363DD3E8
MERLNNNGAEAALRQTPATIGEACIQASLFLEGHGVGEARANAELLMQHLLGLERSGLLRDWRERFPEERFAKWANWIGRKAEGEPVQYIIGEQWFYGLPFQVTPAVLIPRPETELLVEAVLAEADRLWPAPARPVVLDVGTGSGAIGVTLAVQRPQWELIVSDLSPDALSVARLNAQRHGVAGQLTFVQGDLLQPFVQSQQRIDVLVSNPPYIPAADILELQPEVRDFEPLMALDGGEDGLNPYRAIIKQLDGLADVPRIVAFELGQGQAEAVARLLRNCEKWRDIKIISDYAGIKRHVMAIDYASQPD